MRSEGKSCVLISVVLSLVLFGCVEVSDPPNYPEPDSDSVGTPEDDLVSPGEPTRLAPRPDSVTPGGDLADPILLAREQNPQAVISSAQALIWSEYNTTTNVGSIKIVLHGENIARTIAGATMPVGVAADADNIYWADMGAGSINKISMADGTMSKLATGLASPFYVAVDGDHVYFTDVDAGSVARVNKNGGAVERLADNQDQPSFIAIATNSAGKPQVFWANLGSGGELMAMSTSGGDATMLSDGNDLSNGFVVDNGTVYWSDTASRTVMLYSTELAKTQIVTDAQYGAAGLAMDATNIYWVTQHDGAIHAMNRQTRAVDLLASGQDSPKHLAVGAGRIYWTDAEYGSVFALANN